MIKSGYNDCLSKDLSVTQISVSSHTPICHMIITKLFIDSSKFTYLFGTRTRKTNFWKCLHYWYLFILHCGIISLEAHFVQHNCFRYCTTGFQTETILFKRHLRLFGAVSTLVGMFPMSGISLLIMETNCSD